MSYTVLARKYRPRTFHEVRGQDHTVRALVNALDYDRLHHAYLFSGTRGVGKTTLGRILANCLNCEQGVSSTPCGKCDCCIGFREGSFLDLIEVDAASRTGVEDMRQLLENANLKPSMGRYRVYLIDEVHMLSTSSFNALLKTLEEPPEHVKFVLATTDPKKIPVTVLSRCLQFHLKNISPETVRDQLQEVLDNENVSAETEALDVISQAADGSMRDALSIADQAISHGGGALTLANVSDMLGTARINEVTAILELIVAGDRNGVIEFTQEMAARAVNYSDLLASLQRSIHAMSMFQVTKQIAEESLAQFAEKLSPEWLQVAYQVLLIGTRDLRFAPDHRIGFEMTMLRLLDFEPVEAYPVSQPPERNPISNTDVSSSVEQESTKAKEDHVQDSARQDHLDAQEIGDSEAVDTEDPSQRSEISLEWFEIVKNLSIPIELKQGLHKTELVEKNGQNLILRREQKDSRFWTESKILEVAAAIQDFLGESCSISMQEGELQSETPAQRFSRIRNEEIEHEKDLRDQRKRERQERIEAAKQELENDAFVQALKRDFGAQVGEIRLN